MLADNSQIPLLIASVIFKIHIIEYVVMLPVDENALIPNNTFIGCYFKFRQTYADFYAIAMRSHYSKAGFILWCFESLKEIIHFSCKD